MKINVTYSRGEKIGAVGPSVWAKLGPEDWFDNYRVIAADARGYEAEFVQNLDIGVADIQSVTTQAIIERSDFKDVALRQLPDYRFIVYKPVQPVEGIDQSRFIANDISFARFEDKKVFRDLFTGKIPIPKFEIIKTDELLGMDSEEVYQRFSGQFGPRFVIQDNKNSGGRGTFIVKALDDVEHCQNVLREERLGDYVIISQFIEGIERSTQVFVSKERSIRGPLQQQLVRNDELLDPSGRGGMYFCGGRFLPHWSDKVEAQVSTIVSTISGVLRDEGYKGIFGIDFILDDQENIFVLEVNARTTGLLPLLNEQTSPMPLYLLHILELAGSPYEVGEVDDSYWRMGQATGPASFVVLSNTSGKTGYLDEAVGTGNYVLTEGKLEKIDDRARWNPQSDVMLQLFCSEDSPSKPYVKLANIFLKNPGFDEKGILTDDTRAVVDYLKKHIVH
jgi:glutathione synthase/RimK-type ligase-like ATP-grasp enzyme